MLVCSGFKVLRSFNRSGGGNLRSIIEKSGRGFSIWIRFEDLNLDYLFERVEICCRDEDLVRSSKA